MRSTLIKWDPGDEIDWTTPRPTYRDHEFCGNCGLDAPGCGCPCDCDTCQERMRTYCGHLESQPSQAGEDWEGWDDEDGD